MLGIALRLSSVMFLALMFAGVKYVAQHGVHILETLFWRQAAGLPVALLWVITTSSLGTIVTYRPFQHALRMVIGLSAMALNFWAATMLPLAEATTIGFAIPILSTIFAALLLRETAGIWRWSAVLIGLLGILIVMRPGTALLSIGAVIACAGAIMTALVTIVIRHLTRSENTGAIVFWFSLSSLLPLGIAMPFVITAHAPYIWIAILALSLCGACAQICLTASLRYAPVATVLPMDYTALIWSTLLGWLIFREWPHPATWIGAPIIIAAGLVILWREQIVKRTLERFSI